MTDVVFCKRLLPPSETFVLDHFDSLPTNSKVLVGLHRVVGGIRSLPTETQLISQSKASAACFELMGQSSEISQALSKISPRVVHAHFANQGTQLQFICRDLGIPLVVSCHGSDVFRSEASLRRAGGGGVLWAQRRHKIGTVDAHFVSVSKFVAQRVADLGVSDDRIHVIPNPLDVKNIEYVADGRDPMTVLFVGRLVEKKGVAELLNAVKMLEFSHPEVELRIIGDGALRESLEAQSSRLRVKASFLGRLDRDEVFSEMQTATVLAVPSRQAEDGDSETFGVVAAEAQASGLPVVVTPHGGLPEVVTDGVGGIVAEGTRSKDIATSLQMVLSDRNLAKQLGRTGRASVAQRFDFPVVGAKFEALYESVSA